MKITKVLVLILIATVVMSVALPAFAADGAAIYKTKCAACHGPEGQGKIGPVVKGTSLTADQITTLLSTGDDAKKAPHKKPIAGVAGDDAKAVADYIKGLK